ncbi:MAG: D-alanine--D-alanine ligase [Desulfatitalea sp.]|nr:D-alanine--D-alanine ligase [Desulfatitalea sp.]NNJ99309.1 D-alanine--D-alanine ligase [Desulfatitalea sp.]
MKLLIAHNTVSEDSHPDDRDVLIQAGAVQGALERLGHSVGRLPCDLDLKESRCRLISDRPDLVFNLVESLAGTGRLIAFFPALLDAMGQPYTGAGAEAIYLSSNKVLAKSSLQAAGLPTPLWTSLEHLRADPSVARQATHWVIKSVWEHASIGIDEDAISVHPTAENLVAGLHRRAPLLGGSCFAEAFIDGREFNLALLDGPDGVQVLPPAEILFEGYGPDQVRIVDYSAKWDETSYAYHHTPRNYDFSREDQALVQRLIRLSIDCWKLLGLRGYARVDFRVDRQLRPWILEVNANPCLSPDAGFAAALDRAGVSFDKAVERIVSSTMKS